MKSPAAMWEDLRRPLPDYASAVEARRAAAEAMRPPEQVTVSEAAEKYRILNNQGGGYVGPWRNAVVPYMVEPMDSLTSRYYAAEVFVGPAQSAKTEALFGNWSLYSIVCDPADMLMIQTTRGIATDFSERRLEPMIEACSEARERWVKDRSSALRLVMSSGTRLALGWPSRNELRGRPVPRVGATDYDAAPDDVGGEGGLFDLMRPRTRTFGSAGMVLAESSPAKPILRSDWRPAPGSHEAPPCEGILGLYNQGTRARLYWPCPHCGEYFEGRPEHLDYPRKVDPAAAGAAAVMVCPRNGCVIEFKARRDMLAAARWVHEGQRIEAGEVVGERRKTDVVSYWLNGTAAAFSTWAQLVSAYVAAEIEFDRSGDEKRLRTVTNTDFGLPYLSRAQAEAAKRDPEKLRGLAGAFPLREVPAEARVLLAAVDVQGNRFVVQVEAWGLNRERWLIDRFEIFSPPPEAPEAAPGPDGEPARMLDPASYLEDWSAIERQVIEREYPLEGDPSACWRPRLVLVDSGGADGATGNAYDWWRGLKRSGLDGRVRLVKGGSTPEAPRVVETYPDSKRKDRKAGALGEIPVLMLNTLRLKDEVAGAMMREAAGRGKLHLPADLPGAVFAELCAETRGPKGWKNDSGRRNEAFDLAGYCLAGALYLRLDRMTADRAPEWARPGAENAISREAGRPAETVRRHTREERLARIAKGLAT